MRMKNNFLGNMFAFPNVSDNISIIKQILILMPRVVNKTIAPCGRINPTKISFYAFYSTNTFFKNICKF